MRAYIVASVLVLLFSAALPAAKTLDVYVIDADAGKAMLVVTPSGQSMVVDAGYAGFIDEKSQVVKPNDLDADRIVRLVKLAKLKQIDYLVVTNYHNDQAENVPKLVAKAGIPVRNFVDHGQPVEQDPLTQAIFKAYTNAIGKANRITVKPGDAIPLKGVQVQVLASAGATIKNPLPGAGTPNPLCAAAAAAPADNGENGASIGLLYTFGKFRMIDLADLTKPKEYDLMCPNNLVGMVDLFLVSHHGSDLSNSPQLVYELHPQVAIMNNGAKQGNERQTATVVRTSPGIVDSWQLHYSVDGSPENNTAPNRIANPQQQPDPQSFGYVLDDKGDYIKVSAQENGDFTVTNSRNGFTQTYKKHEHRP